MFRVKKRKAMKVAVVAAVLGATAPMLADGPWGGWGLGVRFGDGRGRDRRERQPARPPVVVHPPVHAHRPVEEAPCELTLMAYQAGDTVIVIARGENRAAGFTTGFLACDTRGGTPEVTMLNTAPAHHSTQVHTAFEVSGSFRSHRAVDMIDVRVAGVCHHVRVNQVHRMH